MFYFWMLILVVCYITLDCIKLQLAQFGRLMTYWSIFQASEAIKEPYMICITRNKYKITKMAKTLNWLGLHISVQCLLESRGWDASNDVWNMAGGLHITIVG